VQYNGKIWKWDTIILKKTQELAKSMLEESKEPDLLYFGAHFPESVSFYRQAKELKVNAKLYTTTGTAGMPDWLTVMKKDGDYVLAQQPWHPDMSYKGPFFTSKSFDNYWKQKYGTGAAFFSAVFPLNSGASDWRNIFATVPFPRSYIAPSPPRPISLNRLGSQPLTLIHNITFPTSSLMHPVLCRFFPSLCLHLFRS
jgi:hypothetical protein